MQRENLTDATVIPGAGHEAMIQTTSELRRTLKWLLLAVLAALVTYVAFRGYQSSDMLLNFANSFHC